MESKPVLVDREEAAKVADGWDFGKIIAAEIRALPPYTTAAAQPVGSVSDLIAHHCTDKWRPYPSVLCSNCKETHHYEFTVRGLCDKLNAHPAPTTEARELASKIVETVWKYVQRYDDGEIWMETLKAEAAVRRLLNATALSSTPSVGAIRKAVDWFDKDWASGADGLISSGCLVANELRAALEALQPSTPSKKEND